MSGNKLRNNIIREKALAEIGFTILRFNDDEVLTDIGNVNRTICSYIEEFENKFKS